MADRQTVVVYSEIEKHRVIWGTQGPRLDKGDENEDGIVTLLELMKFRKTPTISFAAAQQGHDQLVTTLVARCREGAEVWSMMEQVLRIAILKYKGAEAEAAELVRQLERRLPR
ncbi:hypothetical protein GCM10022251_25380 [Phytohabitans flavus]|uniref:EF-hand domain-containing protein n=1 Tax=Phytohabitans flavus TaxID=1076124 RepID=A0A6F8XR83_9ACTN|nr:hypothetical protein [Phytohabitans flavus]BCB76258.1 hypothetical protein Pflav_026680 [Phytohabitans flavus]